MKDARELRSAHPYGGGGFECVVALIGIEWTEFVTELGFIIDEQVDPAVHVVHEVHIAAGMRVPGEARIIDRERRHRDVKIVPAGTEGNRADSSGRASARRHGRPQRDT